MIEEGDLIDDKREARERPGAGASDLETVFSYHDRTKHHLDRFAQSPGFMDWANQPDPFRTYEGAPRIRLDHPPLEDEPLYDELFLPGCVPAAPLDRGMIGRLFRDSLAISAWKQLPGGSAWALRVNPSSGNLHPTEGYLIAGPIEGLSDEAAVYHYAPSHHVLEMRIVLTDDEWRCLAARLPPGSVLVALTTIYWRESWKYGERAFRYCHLDAGHAIGAVACAAGALGRRTRLIEGVPDDALARLLGIAGQSGMEAEHPDALLCLCPEGVPAGSPAGGGDPHGAFSLDLSPEILARLDTITPEGTENRLSPDHHPWPVIDEVAEAMRRNDRVAGAHSVRRNDRVTGARFEPRSVGARRIFSQRRSAQAMDGKTGIGEADFFRMLSRTVPRAGILPFDTLPWRPRLALALFVHRVAGLEPGVYALLRHPSQEEPLRTALHRSAAWTRPAAAPPDLGFFLLQEGDFRRTAQSISCHQAIASDSAFSLGMLAEFEPSLRERGPAFYPRLYWEAGLIGQVLYLEAEAAGLRATGIGCFLDDVMHKLLGIGDRSWQSLYHLTVGGPVEDRRLKTLEPYAHL